MAAECGVCRQSLLPYEYVWRNDERLLGTQKDEEQGQEREEGGDKEKKEKKRGTCGVGVCCAEMKKKRKGKRHARAPSWLPLFIS